VLGWQSAGYDRKLWHGITPLNSL
jgi:hypothetical protein